MPFNITGMIASRKAKLRKRQSLGRRQNLKEITELREERARLEQKQAQVRIIKEEKAKIREIKTAKIKGVAGRIRSGLQKARAGMKKQQAKSRLKSGLGGATGSRDVFSTGTREISFGGRDVFSGTTKAEKPKEKPKRVIINIR